MADTKIFYEEVVFVESCHEILIRAYNKLKKFFGGSLQ